MNVNNITQRERRRMEEQQMRFRFTVHSSLHLSADKNQDQSSMHEVASKLLSLLVFQTQSVLRTDLEQRKNSPYLVQKKYPWIKHSGWHIFLARNCRYIHLQSWQYNEHQK